VTIAKKNFLAVLHFFVGTDVNKRLNLVVGHALLENLQGHAAVLRGAQLPHVASQGPVCNVQPLSGGYRGNPILPGVATGGGIHPHDRVTVPAEFDASLSGAGLIWYTVENGAEVAKGVCAVDLIFLEFGTDSSLQNLSDLLALSSQLWAR
jgi:hypothetical protein